MDRATAEKIFRIQEIARQDECYKALLAEHAVLSEQLLCALEAMPQTQRAAVEDYLGLAVQMHLRLLELACG